MFRPCIDLHKGKVKQIVGGTLSDSEEKLIENYVSEKPPKYYANLFKKHGLKGGHVIMLGPGNEEAAIEALNEYPKGLQVGGGINPDNAKFYIEQGASHVIVTSYVFNNGKIDFDKLEKLLNSIPKENLVLDLSCRKKGDSYFVVTDRWQKFTDFKLNEKNLELLSKYCDEFLVHGVDVEGKKQGIELELVEKLAKWSKIPVTYAGGIRTFEDINMINKIGKGLIHYTVGSALDLFGGNLNYEEIVNKYSKEL